MALVKCYECDKEISEYAKICPHCGVIGMRARGVNVRQRVLGIVMALIGFAVIVLSASDMVENIDSRLKFFSALLFIMGVFLAGGKSRRKN